MTPTIYTHIAQGTDEWHDLRRGMVTASAIGKLLTPTLKVADNEASRNVLDTICMERITGWTENLPTTWDMDRGTMEEPVARARYAEAWNVTVTEVGFMVREFDGHSLGYSPDGLVGIDGLIEIKAPRRTKHMRTLISGVMPDEHMAQVQCGLLVAGREWCDFISWHAGLPMFVTRIHAIPEWQEAIPKALAALEEAVLERTSEYLTAAAKYPTTDRPDYIEV